MLSPILLFSRQIIQPYIYRPLPYGLWKRQPFFLTPVYLSHVEPLRLPHQWVNQARVSSICRLFSPGGVLTLWFTLGSLTLWSSRAYIVRLHSGNAEQVFGDDSAKPVRQNFFPVENRILALDTGGGEEVSHMIICRTGLGWYQAYILISLMWSHWSLKPKL